MCTMTLHTRKLLNVSCTFCHLHHSISFLSSFLLLGHMFTKLGIAPNLIPFLHLLIFPKGKSYNYLTSQMDSMTDRAYY